MKQSTLIRQLKEAAPEFEKLSWLEEVVLFGPALQEDPIDTDVDLLLITGRTLLAREMQELTERLQHFLEQRLKQPLDLRITTTQALDSPRAGDVGYGRILRHPTVSVFRRKP